MAEREGRLHIGVDVGGTFTDLVVTIDGENRTILHKLPSTPERPDRAIIDGIREVLAARGLAAADVSHLAHGTTVGTNALIQRRGGKVALVTSEGFRDLLEIGRQTRPRVYNIHLDHPKPLVERALRLEVPERRLADGSVHRALDEERLRELAEVILHEEVDCVVVCFLHSYAWPEHERRAVGILADALPDSVRVIASSSVYPEFREYERLSTAVLNGALLTTMGTYLDRLTGEVSGLGIGAEPKVSQSAGGLMSVEMARRFPVRASLSGPAAGVLGAARRAAAAGYRDVITLDMGGTSADVSLLRDARPTEVHERTLAGFPLRLPALDVNAVGAGGGSIAWIDQDGLLKVGPRSAGAAPGPACYAAGGTEATVTDANVVLGRLNDTALLDGQMPIDRSLARAAVEALAGALCLGTQETALGIIRVAGATMVKAIRSISVERGHHPAGFALFVYGGAGPLHAVDVARELEIGTVIVPPNPGILCADGALASGLRNDFVRTVLLPLDPGRDPGGERGARGDHGRSGGLVRERRGPGIRPFARMERRSALSRPELRDPGALEGAGARPGGDRGARRRVSRRPRTAVRVRVGGRDDPARERQGEVRSRPAGSADPPSRARPPPRRRPASAKPSSIAAAAGRARSTAAATSHRARPSTDPRSWSSSTPPSSCSRGIGCRSTRGETW